MKKLLSLTLVLALALSLAAPALAAEPAPDPIPPAVQDLSDEADVVEISDDDWDAQVTAWLAAHPDEAAAFDADAWFAEQVGDTMTKQQYLALNRLTEEEFQADMLEYWAASRLYQERQQAELDDFLAEHPGALDGFDPDAWFAEHYYYYDNKEEYLEIWYLTEEEFRQQMAMEFIRSIQVKETQAKRIADYEAAHPGAYAAFDADAWLSEHHSWTTKQDYMSTRGLDEAGFREAMFLEYLGVVDERDARRQAVEAYLTEHPGALDGFDPAAQLERYGYRDPKTAFMDDYDLESDQDFLEYLQYDYITALQERASRKETIAAYEAEHPGTVAGFDADAYFAENYTYYSREEFMSYLALETEEDFRDYLLCEYIQYQDYGGWYETDRDAEKAALGGMPGELGIMVNGVYLAFPDQKPYAQDGTVYVPADVLAEALGREPGTVTTNGYAPLRASAEEAGCAVWWDPAFETAVLIDPAALSGELDPSFTILNAAMAQRDRDPAKNYKTTCTVAIDATLFNSIDGDKTFAMSAALEVLASPEGASLSGTYDLSAMKDLLREAMGEELYGYLTEDGGEALESLLNLLSKGDFEVRADYETGTLYLTASSFPSLFSIMGKAYPKDVWLSWESAATAAGSTGTVGGILAASALSVAELSGDDPVYYYQSAAEYGQMYVGLLGDANFEQKGGDQVLSLDAEALSAMIYELLGYDAYYMNYARFQELSLELTVKADGAISGSFAFRPQSAYSALADIRVAGGWSSDGEREDAAIEYHLKNFFKVLITIESETKPTGQKPETTPPEKAAVVPMDEVAG